MISPASIAPQAPAEPCRIEQAALVSEHLQDLTDSELERHIRDCGGQMLMAMARWERYGDFADRGDASRWLRLQNEAIAARSPERIAQMEAERGLA